MRVGLTQKRYKRFAFPPTRGFVPAELTQAMRCSGDLNCCIVTSYGNAAIELRARDAFVAERERYKTSRAARRPINVSREA